MLTINSFSENRTKRLHKPRKNQQDPPSGTCETSRQTRENPVWNPHQTRENPASDPRDFAWTRVKPAWDPDGPRITPGWHPRAECVLSIGYFCTVVYYMNIITAVRAWQMNMIMRVQGIISSLQCAIICAIISFNMYKSTH